MPAPFTLRPLAPSDSPRLWALDQRCFPPGIAYSPAEIKEFLLIHGAYHRAIELGAPPALAGFILTVRNRDRGHVVTLDVAPEFRRQGLGQALMEAAEAHFGIHRRAGLVGMRLEVAVNNASALRFYVRLGYRVVRTLRGYYAADLDGLLLHKDWPANPRP